MDFDLSDNPTFADLKQWFESNIEQLPETLKSEGIFYQDPKFTARVYIETVEQRIQFCKESNIHPAKDRIATTNKNNLLRLYLDLQILDNWNKPLEKLKI